MIRRYFVYFAAALFCFACGAFAALDACRNDGRREFPPVPADRSFPVAEPVIYETAETAPAVKRETAACADRELASFWSDLKKNKDFVERLEGAEENADCEEMLEIEKRDLNADREPEFIVWGRTGSALCGATGNCAVWVYERKKGAVRLLLHSVAYNDAEKWFEVKTKESRGYRNLLLKARFTAAETTHHFYKFDGAAYVEEKCLMNRYFAYEKKGSVTPCAEYFEKY